MCIIMNTAKDFYRHFKLVPIASLSIMTLILLLSVSPIVYSSSIVLGEAGRQASPETSC